MAFWRAEAGAAELNSGDPYLPGDADLDGLVDGADFLMWNANKVTMIPAWCSGDFSANGVIDGSDFLIWNQFKFHIADAAGTVPEPSVPTISLLLVYLSMLTTGTRSGSN